MARRLTLGTHPTLTAEAARKHAKGLLGAAATGQDPAALRTRHRKAETVAEAWPLFLEELTAKAKPRTSSEWARLGRVEILPKLGTTRLQDVTRAQVARLHLALAGRPYLANRVVEVVRALFAWSIDRGLRPDGQNPASGIKAFTEVQKERYLTTAELARLYTTLETAERSGVPPAAKYLKPLKRATERRETAGTPRKPDPIGIAAIRFLAYSGFREQEALTLRWSDVDLDTGRVKLPDTKSGPSHRFLGEPAREVLRSVAKYRDGEYVFPGRTLGTHREGVRRIWDAIREHAEIEDVRIHDLRHTVAAVAASGGASLLLIGGLLGHKSTRSTQRYAHLIDAAQQQAADRTAGDIHAAMTGQKTAVTPMRRKRGTGR